MSEPASDRPGLANAQVTGGGGHEPDPDATTGAGEAQAPANTGSGVDLKSDNLPGEG